MRVTITVNIIMFVAAVTGTRFYVGQYNVTPRSREHHSRAVMPLLKND